MAEKLTLTTPVAKPSITEYTIDMIYFNWRDKVIHIDIRSNTNEQISKEYQSDDAMTKMIALNKANLSTKSLQKRIMEQLIADGVIVGSITGVPD